MNILIWIQTNGNSGTGWLGPGLEDQPKKMKQTYITEQLYPPFTPTLHLFVHFPVVLFRKNQFKFSFAFISIIIINTIKFIKDETRFIKKCQPLILSLVCQLNEQIFCISVVCVYVCECICANFFFTFIYSSSLFFLTHFFTTYEAYQKKKKIVILRNLCYCYCC